MFNSMVFILGGRKKRVMINLPLETVENARRLGLNISKVSENALNEAIRRLEDSNPSNISQCSSFNASSAHAKFN